MKGRLRFNDPMLNKDDVARMLRCCERSLERKVRDGQFPPPVRMGKESLWFQSVVHAWLEAKQREQLTWQPRPSASARKAPAKKVTRAAKSGRQGAGFGDVTARESPAASVFTPEQLVQIGRPVELESL